MPDSNEPSALFAPSDPFNDRDDDGPSDGVLPKPHIEIILDGNSIYKPGMKTFFVQEGDDKTALVSSDGVVGGEFCTCDVVYTSTSSCACNSHCSCEDVCNCDSYIACSCDRQSSTCSCVSYTSTVCSCQSVSCGSPCACVPVH